MDISFLPEQQQVFVNQQAKRLGYRSPDEWVQDLAQEAIFDQMVKANPALKAQIDASLDRGLEDIEAGRTMSAEECFNSIREELKAKYKN